MHSQVCDNNYDASGIPSKPFLCNCVLQFRPSESRCVNRELEAHRLRDPHFEMLINEREHDIDDHVVDMNQLPGKTLSSAPRRTGSMVPGPIVHPPLNSNRMQLNWPQSNNAIADTLSHRDTAPSKSFGDLLNLQEIRDEIALLRQKFDEDLKNVRDTLTDNMTEIGHLLNETKVIADGRVNENVFPEDILRSLHRDFQDAMRHRRVFETNIANCERSLAQKGIFDILEHIDDGDADVIRIRALLDDAVNSIESVPKSLSRTQAPKAAHHVTRLSTSKQASKRSAKSTDQRPSSSAPKINSSAVASMREKPTGLADLVGFSTEDSIATTPRMRCPRVPHPPILPQKALTISEKTIRLDRKKIVEFERFQSQTKNPANSAEARSKSLRLIPLGVRQYTMWPSETAPKPTVLSMENRPKEDENLSAGDIKQKLETTLNQHLYRHTSQLRFQDRSTGTCRQDFTKEEALSPILSPKKPFFVDAQSSPRVTRNVSRAQSVQSIPRGRSPSLPSVTSEFTLMSDRPQSAPFKTRSSIFSMSAESPVVVNEEVESVGTGGFSLTDPRSFSDGVWLDLDRSEGEYGGIAIRGFKGIISLNQELGPLPSPNESVSMVSPSQEEKTYSEGEFTLDQVNNQPGVWVPPWQDPLLHLIALDTAGESSKLPWNQQHTVEKVAAILDDRLCRRVGSESEELDCCSMEDLSWVKRIAAAKRARKQSESLAPKNGDKSDGEVSRPTSSKEFRRAVLTRSSQRMLQKETSPADDDDDTLREESFLIEHESSELPSVMKPPSAKEGDEISTHVSAPGEDLQSA